MHIKTAVLQGQKSLFLLSLLRIVIFAWTFYLSAKNSKKREHKFKTESVDLVFIEAQKNTAPVRETGSDPTDLIYSVILNPKALKKNFFQLTAFRPYFRKNRFR